MSHMRISAILIGLLVGLAAVGSGAAEKPQFREDDDKFVLQNDHVSVWFQGKKPMLRVMPADVALQADEGAIDVDASATLETGEAGYMYKFTKVIEYNDLDGDAVPDANEIVATLNLEKASAWTVDTNGSTDERAVLDLRLDAPVKVGNGEVVPDDAPLGLPDATASIGLVFTIAQQATVVNASGVDITVPATSVKYDFVVDSWPFVNADSNRLALETKVVGDLEVENGTGVEGAQVMANDTAVGALSWTTLAVGNTTEGETVDVPVKTAISSAVDGEATIVYTYDAAGLASLVHDPTIGTTTTPEAMQTGSEETSRSVPAAGFALVGVAVAGVAVLARRK